MIQHPNIIVQSVNYETAARLIESSDQTCPRLSCALPKKTLTISHVKLSHLEAYQASYLCENVQSYGSWFPLDPPGRKATTTTTINQNRYVCGYDHSLNYVPAPPAPPRLASSFPASFLASYLASYLRATRMTTMKCHKSLVHFTSDTETISIVHN